MESTMLTNPTTTITTKTTDFSPYLKFTYALNAPESKRQYPKRFQIFLMQFYITHIGIEIRTSSILAA